MKEEESKDRCEDKKCPFHGSLSARGRRFKGIVKKIVGRRAAIEFELLLHYKKYERYAKAKTRLHAYIPECLIPRVKVGSMVKVSECRPLSKIIHFVVLDVMEKETKEGKK